MRFFLFVFLLFVHLGAMSYPQLYSTLGDPLYKAVPQFEKLQNIEGLKEEILEYNTQAKDLMQVGLQAQQEGSKEKKEYLFALRELQKKYDYLIHLLHVSVHEAIDEDHYALFVKLTAYPFDSFLKARSISQRSYDYYQKYRTKKHIEIFEKMTKMRKGIENAKNYNAQLEYASYDSNTQSKKKKSVFVLSKKYQDKISIFIKNTNPYTVTVSFDGNYQNLKAHNYTKKAFVLAPYSQIHYADLYPQKSSAGYRYTYSYRWIMGSKDTQHDDTYIYRLPFSKGSSYMVSQGFHGKFTHSGQSEYAVDFSMDIGTKIYAARDGVVVKTKSDSNKVGQSEEFAKYGNYVTVEHTDHSFATYYHLKQYGVLVKVGQKVVRGSPLGYSGNTGYSTGPHLHFEVFKTSKNAMSVESIPIRFASVSGVIKEPEEGKFYTAK